MGNHPALPGAPVATHRGHATGVRSPFVCGNACGQIFGQVLDKMLRVLPNRSQVVGYLSGGLV